MAEHVSWAQRARVVIARVQRENPGLAGDALKKKLSEAYPFGERAYHPYKVWLKEVKRAVNGFGRLPHRPQVGDLPGQGSLFDLQRKVSE